MKEIANWAHRHPVAVVIIVMFSISAVIKYPALVVLILAGLFAAWWWNRGKAREAERQRLAAESQHNLEQMREYGYQDPFFQHNWSSGIYPTERMKDKDKD